MFRSTRILTTIISNCTHLSLWLMCALGSHTHKALCHLSYHTNITTVYANRTEKCCIWRTHEMQFQSLNGFWLTLFESAIERYISQNSPQVEHPTKKGIRKTVRNERKINECGHEWNKKNVLMSYAYRIICCECVWTMYLYIRRTYNIRIDCIITADELVSRLLAFYTVKPR